MERAVSVNFQFFILFGALCLIKAQSCFNPTKDLVESVFSNINPGHPPGAVFGSDIYYTCMAQAGERSTFREVSVVIQYTHNGMKVVKQFELDCVSGTWNGRVGSVTDVPDSFNYTSITTRTDCSSCNNTADNDYHCEACDPACNVGSRRCTGPGPNDCCPVFSGLLCFTSCPKNSFATEYTNDYQCLPVPCTLPDNSTLVSLLETSTSQQAITLRGGPYYTCQVQGYVKGTYTHLSVALEYTDNGGADKVGYFDLICYLSDPVMWSMFRDEVHFLPGAHYNDSIGLRTDCFRCSSTLSNTEILNSCQDYQCPDECSVGLNRCNSAKCCVAFEDNGFCKTNFDCNKNNFVAKEENNYTCSCGLSCLDGYTLDSANCTGCTLTDICVADNPCNNNGVCILDTAPDQYTCNCTGTGYTGTNCTECSLTCPRGYVLDGKCMCLLDDICVADNPCSNGGTCVLGSSSDKYSCQCVDYYSGINCTECSLECLNRGLIDQYCMSCDCVAGYTGRNCSECDRGYSVDMDGGCTPLVNGTLSSTEDRSSSFKWWHVGLPIILLVVLLLVIIAIVIIVGVLVMKNKQDKHKI